MSYENFEAVGTLAHRFFFYFIMGGLVASSKDILLSHTNTSSSPKCQRSLKFGAIGILARDDRFLMIRRAPDIVLGGYWCFPGGHIEPGENSRQAIVREFREELAIEIKPIKKLGYIRLIDAGYILAVWQVSFLSGTINPEPSEICELRWVLVDDIQTVEPGLPSNRIAYDMIKQAL